MSPQFDKTWDENIRSRVLKAGADVVVFDRSNTRSLVLCADPGSGQTPGFAQSPKLFLYLTEDPALLRIPQDSEKLRQHLLGVVETPSVFSVPHVVADSGMGVEIAPPQWRPIYHIDPYLPHKQVLITLASNFLSRLADVCSLSAGSGSVHIISLLYLLKNLRRMGVKNSHTVVNTIDFLRNTALRGIKQVRELAKPRQIRIKVTTPALPKIKLPEIELKLLLRVTGQGFIIASIVLFLMTVGPIIRLQAGEWWTKSRTAITGKAIEPQVKEVLTDTIRKPEEIPPEEKQFQLLIPKLDANMKVMANVDAGDEIAYKSALKQGVAHAAGSGLPGEPNDTNKTVYIFGHSTNGLWNVAKYNALFYSLKDLAEGDEIIVWFWGKEFHYTVEKIVKVDPADLTYLKPQVLRDQLILQTCWPPGTTWKRLLVVAVPK